MSAELDVDLAWDWDYRRPEIEQEWVRHHNPEVCLNRKRIWYRMLKAMRGVKNSNLVWLHYYEGYEVRELADTFQMKESEVRAAMESAASTVRRKFMMKPQGAWNET